MGGVPLPGHVVDEAALERRDRGVEGLERRERDHVDLRDGTVCEPAPQVQGQRFHLGELGHPPSLGRIRDR